MRLLYLNLRRPGHGGDCPASAPHGYGSLTQHVMVITLLYLPENPALIQVLRWPRHSLDLFLLELLAWRILFRILLGGYLRLLNRICRQFLTSRGSILSHGRQLYVILVDKLGLHPVHLLSLLGCIL